MHLQALNAYSHPPISDSSYICDTSKLSKCIPDTLHFISPILRVVFLLPLFFILFSPRVVYLPADSQPDIAEAENAPLVGQSSVLLQEEATEAVSGGEGSKYGTFAAHGPEPSAATVRPEVS